MRGTRKRRVPLAYLSLGSPLWHLAIGGFTRDTFAQRMDTEETRDFRPFDFAAANCELDIYDL